MLSTPRIASAIALVESYTGTTPALCARGSVIEVRFRIHDEHAPALRSAVEEMANEIGGRLEGMHTFAQEQSLTDASIAVNALRIAVADRVPAACKHYKPRRRK